MSAGRNGGRPVGRDVYWRRRLLLLAVLIALAWITVQVVGALGDDEPAAAPTTATSATPTTASPTTEAPPTDQISVALVTDAKKCQPKNLRIVPSVPGGQRSGGAVAVDLMVTTLDGTACTFEPGADDLLVVVDTTRAPIYDSSVCRSAFFEQPVAVPAGWGTVTRVQWSGRGSGTGCGSGEGFAPPGTYTFKIGTYGGEPGEVKFTLAKPAPAATTAPSPKASAKPTTKTSPEPSPQSASPRE